MPGGAGRGQWIINSPHRFQRGTVCRCGMPVAIPIWRISRVFDPPIHIACTLRSNALESVNTSVSN